MSPEGGGPIEGLIQQGILMANNGHEVHALTLQVPGAPVDSRMVSRVVHQMGPCYLNYGYAPRLEPWLMEHGVQFDVIIVHGMWQYHGYCVAKVARKLGIHYCIFLHGMLDPWFARRYPFKHIKKWLYWPWGEYRVLRDARLVLFTTAEELSLARDSFWLYKVRERLVGYGIGAPPPAAPELGRAALLKQFPHLEETRNLLYLSRIHPKKGCDLLLTAFSKVAAAHPNLHLVMAGPGEARYVDLLKQQALKQGVADRVTFTGMLSGGVKWGAYELADAFVLTSHQENFGIVLAEALACGVPVLTTYQVNIWREIHNANAGIIHADTQHGADQLLIEWLALDSSQQATMRDNAVTCFRKHFEIARVTKQLLAALEESKHAEPVPHTFVGNFF